MKRTELAIIWVAVAVALACSALSRPEPPPPHDWGIRVDYFDPRIEKAEWIDVLDSLGKNFLCNQHPATVTRTDGPYWQHSGESLKEDFLILEFHVRYTASGCINLLPFKAGAFAVEGLWSDCAVFLDGKAVGQARLESQLSVDDYVGKSQSPENFRRIQFVITGMTKRQELRLLEAIKNNPYPARYESRYDPRAGTYDGKPIKRVSQEP